MDILFSYTFVLYISIQLSTASSAPLFDKAVDPNIDSENVLRKKKEMDKGYMARKSIAQAMQSSKSRKEQELTPYRKHLSDTGADLREKTVVADGTKESADRRTIWQYWARLSKMDVGGTNPRLRQQMPALKQSQIPMYWARKFVEGSKLAPNNRQKRNDKKQENQLGVYCNEEHCGWPP